MWKWWDSNATQFLNAALSIHPFFPVIGHPVIPLPGGGSANLWSKESGCTPRYRSWILPRLVPVMRKSSCHPRGWELGQLHRKTSRSTWKFEVIHSQIVTWVWKGCFFWPCVVAPGKWAKKLSCESTTPFLEISSHLVNNRYPTLFKSFIDRLFRVQIPPQKLLRSNGTLLLPRTKWFQCLRWSDFTNHQWLCTTLLFSSSEGESTNVAMAKYDGAPPYVFQRGRQGREEQRQQQQQQQQQLIPFAFSPFGQHFSCQKSPKCPSLACLGPTHLPTFNSSHRWRHPTRNCTAPASWIHHLIGTLPKKTYPKIYILQPVMSYFFGLSVYTYINIYIYIIYLILVGGLSGIHLKISNLKFEI